jgi:tetratricopeptide (TPR) repeat protein
MRSTLRRGWHWLPYSLPRRFSETEETLLGVLTLEAQNQKAKLQLGIVRCMAGKFQLALEPLKEVLQWESHPASAHLYLGIALLESGRLADAEAQFNEVLASTDGDAATTHYCLGRLHAKAGKLEQSIQSFEVFLNMKPNAPDAKAIQATIERMKSALADGPL